MKVALKDLVNALDTVQAFGNLDKTKPGILVKASDGKIRLCYANGNLGVFASLPYVAEEGDITEDFIVDYDGFNNIINQCKVSGLLTVSDITFKFKAVEGEQSGDTLTISADKYIKVIESVEAPVSDASATELGEVQFMSSDGAEDASSSQSQEVQKLEFYGHMAQEIPYIPISKATLKNKVLNRVGYDEIIPNDDAIENGVVSPDVFDGVTLKNNLAITSADKLKQIYMSKKNPIMFVCNQNYTLAITTDLVKSSYIVSAAHAKALSDMLGKRKSDEVYSWVSNQRYMNIYDKSGEFGVQIVMPVPSKNDLTTIDRLEAQPYDLIQMTFATECFKDILNSAKQSNTDGKMIFTFSKGVDEKSGEEFSQIVIGNGVRKGSSFRLRLKGLNLLDESILENMKITTSIEVIQKMISSVKGEFVALDIDYANGDSLLRLSDIDADTQANLMTDLINKYAEDGVSVDNIPVADRMGIRRSYIPTRSYTRITMEGYTPTT